MTEGPKVFNVGCSQVEWKELDAYLTHRQEIWNKVGGNDTESLVEMAGRVCYQSWNNPHGRSQESYIGEQIIGHAHGSVLEHVWLNFLVADVPRNVQLELVRHGDGTGFSFESTRFTDKHLRFVVPPHFRDNLIEVLEFTYEMNRGVEKYDARVKALTEKYKTLYPDEADKTLRSKRAKEAARATLPNCQGSDGMFSANGRSLRWIIQARTDEHADLSIREFAYAVYLKAREVMPAIFSDATEVAVREGVPMIVFENRKV